MSVMSVVEFIVFCFYVTSKDFMINLGKPPPSWIVAVSVGLAVLMADG